MQNAIDVSWTSLWTRTKVHYALTAFKAEKEENERYSQNSLLKHLFHWTKKDQFLYFQTIGAGGNVILCAKGNSCGFCSLTNKETLNMNEKQFTSQCLKKQPFSEVAKRCAKCDEVSCVSYYALSLNKSTQEILANCVEYGGVKYHRKCFSCSRCKQTLSGQYNIKNGMLFCRDCGMIESNHRNNQTKSKVSVGDEIVHSTKQSGFQYSAYEFFDKEEIPPRPRIKEDEKETGIHRRRKVYIEKKVRYNTLQIRREQDQRIHSSPYVQVNF